MQGSTVLFRHDPAAILPVDKALCEDVEARHLCGQPLRTVGPITTARRQDGHVALEILQRSFSPWITHQYFENGHLEIHRRRLRPSLYVASPPHRRSVAELLLLGRSKARPRRFVPCPSLKDDRLGRARCAFLRCFPIANDLDAGAQDRCPLENKHMKIPGTPSATLGKNMRLRIHSARILEKCLCH